MVKHQNDPEHQNRTISLTKGQLHPIQEATGVALNWEQILCKKESQDAAISDGDVNDEAGLDVDGVVQSNTVKLQFISIVCIY